MDHGNSMNREYDRIAREREMQAELEELRAERDRANETTTAPSTREQSPIKPQDHKPAADETVSVEYAGETFEIKVGVASSARLLRALEKNQISAAVERLIGEDGYDRLLDAIEAQYGEDDMSKVAEFMGTALEAAGAKNS